MYNVQRLQTSDYKMFRDCKHPTKLLNVIIVVELHSFINVTVNDVIDSTYLIHSLNQV